MAKVKIVCRGRCNKDGEAPIEISVSHKGKTAYIKTGVFVMPDNYSDNYGAWVSGMKNARTLNATLEAALTRAKSELIKIENSTGTRGIDCNTLRDMLSPDYDGSEVVKKDNEKRTLGYRWSVYTRTMREDTQTPRIYKDALRSITCFDATIKDRDIAEIDKEWIASYEEWCKTSGISGNGNGENTIISHMRCLKAVINDSIKDDVLEKNPFRRYSIVKAKPTEERPMTEEELRLVFGYKTNDAKKRAWVDLFKLCFYLRGINMIDMSKLTSVDDDGYIRYIRTKTKNRRPTKIAIKVEPEIKDLIDKYKGEEHLLRFFDEHKFNIASRIMINYVKQIDAPIERNPKTKRNNINYDKSTLKDVQQYASRRTWATIAYNECGIPMDVVSLCLGHKDMGLSVTQRYVRPDQKVVDDANRKVIDYLNKLKDGGGKHIQRKDTEQGG